MCFKRGVFPMLLKAAPDWRWKFPSLPLQISPWCAKRFASATAKLWVHKPTAPRGNLLAVCAHTFTCAGLFQFSLAAPIQTGCKISSYLNFSGAQTLFSWQDHRRLPWPFLVQWYPKLLWSQVGKDGRRWNNVLLLCLCALQGRGSIPKPPSTRLYQLWGRSVPCSQLRSGAAISLPAAAVAGACCLESTSTSSFHLFPSRFPCVWFLHWAWQKLSPGELCYDLLIHPMPGGITHLCGREAWLCCSFHRTPPYGKPLPELP